MPEMIKSIDEIMCTNCGLCEKVCPVDIFRTDDNGRVYIAYRGDCCNCLQCMYVCPVDAVVFAPGEPKKYNMDNEWNVIKEMMGGS